MAGPDLDHAQESSRDMTSGTREDLRQILGRDQEEWLAEIGDRNRSLAAVMDGTATAVVYPAARLGRRAARALRAKGVRVTAFGDGNASLHGSTIDGLPVLSPQEVADRHSDDVVLIASTLHDSAIRGSLHALGCRNVISVGALNRLAPDAFSIREYDDAAATIHDPSSRSQIEAAHELLGDAELRVVFVRKVAFYLGLDKANIEAIRSAAPIYFDRSVFSLQTDEVVVDGGAFVGDTLRAFQTLARDFREYVAFEPDAASFAILAEVARGDPERITAVNAGLGQRTEVMRFLSTEGADSRLLRPDEVGGIPVPLVALDDYFVRRRPPTLIKLDVEGAEAAALTGARSLIRDNSPVLAVSAYHYPSDLWSIPLLLQGLLPNMQLYLRHYTHEVDDTVCYAIPESRARS